MDKNIASGIKAVLAGFILVSCFFLGGCGTVTGLGKGIVCGVGYTAQCIGKDGHDFCEAVDKADQWVKENLW